MRKLLLVGFLLSLVDCGVDSSGNSVGSTCPLAAGQTLCAHCNGKCYTCSDGKTCSGDSCAGNGKCVGSGGGGAGTCTASTGRVSCTPSPCANGNCYSCAAGSTCTGDACAGTGKCLAGGGGGGGGGGAITTCTCPGDLQCSQKVACLQSCTCYYTINGSDGTSAWYLVGTGGNGAGTCYMCAQNKLSPDCNSAANAAANAAAALVIANPGQCPSL